MALYSLIVLMCRWETAHSLTQASIVNCTKADIYLSLARVHAAGYKWRPRDLPQLKVSWHGLYCTTRE